MQQPSLFMLMCIRRTCACLDAGHHGRSAVDSRCLDLRVQRQQRGRRCARAVTLKQPGRSHMWIRYSHGCTCRSGGAGMTGGGRPAPLAPNARAPLAALMERAAPAAAGLG